MKKRIWKWVGFVSLVLLVWAAVWSYYYIYRPSQLLEAMMNGDKAEIARLIDEEGYNPNVRYFNRVGLLFIIASEKEKPYNLDVIEFMIMKGMSPDGDGKKINNIIQMIIAGRLDVLKILLKHGANINALIKNNSGFELTPLDVAVAFYGIMPNEDIINFLLEHGGKIGGYANSPRVLKNALLCIQQKKCPEILRNKFLEAGTKPELMKEIESEIKKASPTQGGNK